ncbi:MAG: metal-dependent transcriptional regulator, partial [Planctomycetes bacterium]|nr:metal-dependent transcriptional regulator [Planctomycetota bacterium]
AATGQIAAEMGVSPGTVTSMVKTLSDTGLVHYIPYEGVHLTESGKKLALRVLRRHRLIELFLAKTLELNWDEVHDEAENMEHAVSDLLVDRIDQFLGHPEVDPHGDPIPKADGTIVASDSRKLSELAIGELFRLVRVLDQSPRFLRYLSVSGLPLGSQGEVLDKCMEAGVITILVGEKETSLSRDAAAKLLVKAVVGVA